MAGCPTCHNVHGSPSPKMMRHGELISTPLTTDKVPALEFCYLDDVASRNCSIQTPYPNSMGGSMHLSGYPESRNGVHANGVCIYCHKSGYFFYHRTPYDITAPVKPIVGSVKASPLSVANDGASPVLFSAFVVDPNENLDSVTIDLSTLGGIAEQAMNDGGTDGDEVAGDEVYSYLFPGTTALTGTYYLTITATDRDANGDTGEVVVVVHDNYGAIVVDNLEATFVCSWPTSTSSPDQRWGPDFRYRTVKTGGDGSCTATWVSTIPEIGNYSVYARWTSNIYRATNVPYTINYNGNSQTVWVNQQQNGGNWYLLGTFNFAAGNSGSVVLSDNATGGEPYRGNIVADAIKWEPQP